MNIKKTKVEIIITSSTSITSIEIDNKTTWRDIFRQFKEIEELIDDKNEKIKNIELQMKKKYDFYKID